jgi:hypothetical protein
MFIKNSVVQIINFQSLPSLPLQVLDLCTFYTARIVHFCYNSATNVLDNLPNSEWETEIIH